MRGSINFTPSWSNLSNFNTLTVELSTIQETLLNPNYTSTSLEGWNLCRSKEQTKSANQKHVTNLQFDTFIFQLPWLIQSIIKFEVTPWERNESTKYQRSRIYWRTRPPESRQQAGELLRRRREEMARRREHNYTC